MLMIMWIFVTSYYAKYKLKKCSLLFYSGELYVH